MPEVATQKWIDQVLDEHRELRQEVAGLREFLQRPRPELGQEGCHRWAAALAKRLVTLHDHLFRHFRFEERSEMVEDVSRKHPRAATAVKRLVGEHQQMLDELRSATADVLAYSEGRKPCEQPRIRTRLNGVLDQLQRHEEEETDLIQRLEYRDTGAAD